MKPREIIILLLAAAFGAIAIVTWNGEEEAKQQTAKALAELTQTKADAEAASKQAATSLAKTKADAEAAAAANAGKRLRIPACCATSLSETPEPMSNPFAEFSAEMVCSSSRSAKPIRFCGVN